MEEENYHGGLNVKGIKGNDHGFSEEIELYDPLNENYNNKDNNTNVKREKNFIRKFYDGFDDKRNEKKDIIMRNELIDLRKYLINYIDRPKDDEFMLGFLADDMGDKLRKKFENIHEKYANRNLERGKKNPILERYFVMFEQYYSMANSYLDNLRPRINTNSGLGLEDKLKVQSSRDSLLEDLAEKQVRLESINDMLNSDDLTDKEYGGMLRELKSSYDKILIKADKLKMDNRDIDSYLALNLEMRENINRIIYPEMDSTEEMLGDWDEEWENEDGN